MGKDRLAGTEFFSTGERKDHDVGIRREKKRPPEIR
jgi:hypothetical protein